MGRVSPGARHGHDAGFRRSRLGYAFALALLLLPSSLDAATPARFTRLSVEHGLSQSIVQVILQDRTGFMWFGTEEGLNRYDGYTFAVYKHDPHDTRSLPDDNVTALHEDRQGRLWVGTQHGLALFDPRTETFARVPATRERISSIVEAPDGTLWIGSEGEGLFERDPSSGKFVLHEQDFDNPASLGSYAVSALLRDRQGRLWIGTRDAGVDLRAEGGERYVHFRNDPSDPRSLSYNEVGGLAEDPAGTIWIATYGGGLNALDPATGTCRRFLHDPSDPNSLGTDRVTCVFVDREGTLWVGTDGVGVQRYDAATGRFTTMTHDPANLASLSQDVVRSIYQDSQGQMWIGTFLGGANVLRNPQHSFAYYTHNTADPSSLSDRNVGSFLEDVDGRIWVGTEKGWLNRFDRETGIFTRYRFPSPEPGGLALLSLHQDRRGRIWVGTYRGGLGRFDPARGTFVTFRHRPGDPRSLDNDEVWAITEDGDGMLWLATNVGVNRFDPDQQVVTGRYRTLDPEQDLYAGARALLFDRRGNLWIGTSGGVFLLSPGSDALVRYRHDEGNPNSLSHDSALALYEDREGRLWVGTYGGGLNHLDPATGTFTSYRSFPSNVIYAIEEESSGQLWLSTNQGLSRFDPATGDVETFNLTNGLQSLQFHLGASLRTRDGRLLFGSLEGIHDFDPAAIAPDTYAPPVVITALRVFNEPAKLPVAISNLDEISLTYDDKVISLEFAALDYTLPRRNRYAYTLEGFSNQWIQLGGKREVTFTNLDPGTYVFRVKASNGDGVWNEASTAALRIVVRPPFWKTWWFRALGIALLAMALVAAHRVRVRRLTATLAERQRVAEELRKSAEEIRNLYNQAPCGYHSLDASGTFVRINDTELAWLGYSRDEVVGKLKITDLVTPEDVELFREQFPLLKERGWLHDVEFEMVRKDGTVMPVLLNVTVVRDEAGEFLMTNSTIFDLTDRKRLEDQLRQSQKMEAVGRLAGGIAHDFNNLLTAILGYSTLALKRINSDERLRGQIEQIHKAAERASALTKQLLAFSRKQVLQPRVLNLNTVVADMDQMLRRLIGEDVTLRTVLEPNLWRVRADPSQIEQVILNLAVNARDAMPLGGKLTIETANVEFDPAYVRNHVSVRPGPYVMVVVSDTGEGMDDATREHIFEPFFTTKESGKGTGMGLSIVYGIVKQSGGWIWVYSEPGQGTSFKVYLPRVDEVAETVEERPPIAGEALQGEETILLVEDEEVVRGLARDVLGTAGYRVIEATRGRQAMAASDAHEGAIDLMVTDVVMPGMSGRELAERLRPRRPEMKVLYISGYTTNAIVHHGILDPDTAFLQKPFTPDALLRKVRETLKAERPRQVD